jgi:two-component system, NarL family, response regulator LiaR
MNANADSHVLLIDPRDLFRKGLGMILGGYADLQVVGQAREEEDALRLLELHLPDVVCLDLDLQGPRRGIQLIGAIHRQFPQTRIVVLTNLLEGVNLREVLREGALSYILKNAAIEELVQAIRSAAQGIPTFSTEVTRRLVQDLSLPVEQHLTQREQQVLDRLGRGWNNQEIADSLNISLSTVQFHVSNILHKLEVHNRIEAATFAVRHQMVDFIDS